MINNTKILKIVFFLSIIKSILAVNVLAVEIDFNEASDLSRFNQRKLDRPFDVLSTQPFGGIGNSGSVVTDGFNSATFADLGLDFTQPGAKITVSSFFFFDDPGLLTDGRAASYGTVYLTDDANSHLVTNNTLFVRFGRANPAGSLPLRDEVFGGPLQGGGGSFPGFQTFLPVGTFVPNNWLRLQVTYENNLSAIKFIINIDNFGSDGTSLVDSVYQETKITPDAVGFGSDTSLYGGFGFEGETLAIDNFVIAPVPEPLTILGAGTAIAFGTTFKRKLKESKLSKGLKNNS